MKIPEQQHININHFSYEDKEKADQLIQKKKLNIKLSMDAATKFSEIEMFNENICTRSIEDFNYGSHTNGKMINVVVKDHHLFLAQSLKNQNKDKRN